TRVRGLHQRLDALHLQRMRDRMQRADRASLRLQALAPQARLRALGERQQQALRRLHAAWHAYGTALRARLRHAGAVLRATRPERRLATLQARLDALRPRPQAAVARRMQADALRLRGLARALEAISPLATIARGFAHLQHEDGRVVRVTRDAAPGDRLRARVGDGQLRVRVEGSEG